MALMSALVDALATNDLAVQFANSYGTVTWSSGQAAVQNDAGYSSALGSTVTSFTLTASSIYAKITPYISSGAATYLQLTASSGNDVSLTYTGGVLQAAITQGGAYAYIGDVAYNATTMAWWRIREASGTIYYDTSPDGSTWTNQFSTAYTMSVASMSAWLYAGGAATTGNSYIANINTTGAPGGPVSSTGSVALAAPAVRAGTSGGGPSGGLVYMGGYNSTGTNASAVAWAEAQGVPAAGGFQSVYNWGSNWTGSNSVEQVQVGQAQAMVGYAGPKCLNVAMTQGPNETNLSSALSGSSLTSGCQTAHAATAVACLASGVQFIRMAWEFNGGGGYNWMPPWGNYTSAEFITLWRLIFNVYNAAAVAAGKPSGWFKFVYCLVQADGNGAADLEDFFPGGAFAQYLTIDEYDRTQGSYTGWNEALNDPPGLAQSVTYALAQGCEGVGMPEWGIRNDAYGPAVIPEPSYISSAFTWMRSVTEQGLNVLAWPWGQGYSGDITNIAQGPDSWNFAAWPTMWSALTANVAAGVSEGWIATTNPTDAANITISSTGTAAMARRAVAGAASVSGVSAVGSVAMAASGVSGSATESIPSVSSAGSVAIAAPSVGGSSWPGYYTYNFCPNPSAEVSILGYAPVLGTEAVGLSDIAYAGQASAGVSTPGSVPGEGVSTPVGQVNADADGSASVWIFGESGNLTVSAILSGGMVLGSVPVTLSGGWTRVVLNSLALQAGMPLQLLIVTTTTQALNFSVDAVQYEPESPARPYIDGDNPNCTWTGARGLSASYQQFQNTISMFGGIVVEGTIATVAQGAVIPIGNTNPADGPLVYIEGQIDLSGLEHPMVAVSGTRTVIAPAIDPGVPGLPWEIAGGGTITAITIISPPGGVGDFGAWETGVDPDPAMSMIGWNNAGTLSGQTSYNRIYAEFTPPVAVRDSQGSNLWNAAAFMAVGFKASALPVYASGTPHAVNVTAVQVEKMPVTAGASPAPSAYQLPRSLSTIVRPTQMNLVPNPSMQVSTAGWTEILGASLTLNTALSYDAEDDNSLGVSVPTSGGGAYITITGLITGDTYTASAHVNAGSANIQDIFMNVGALSSSATAFGTPLYGGDIANPGFGAGPYGGVAATTTPMPDTSSSWFRPALTFQAPASSIQLALIPLAVSGASYPLVFNVDAVMVSPGEVVGPYGDGNTDGWQWEQGGAAGLSASFYYERQNVAAQAVQQVLSQHIPLGLSAYVPQWSLPPTQ